MSIKTKSDAIRKKELSYIKSSNDLVGEMNPLKMFFCEFGIDKTDASSVNWHFKDAINKLRFVSGADTNVVDNKITQGVLGFQVLRDSNGSNDAIEVANALSIDSTTDVLMILAGSNATNDVNGQNTFNIRDDSTGGFLGIRSVVGFGTQSSRFVDDNAVTIESVGTLTTLGDQVLIGAFDRSGNLDSHRNQGTAASIDENSLAMTTANGALSIATLPVMSLNTDAAACGVYHFPNGLPNNWKEAASWLGWQWLNQNYISGHPSWASL